MAEPNERAGLPDELNEPLGLAPRSKRAPLGLRQLVVGGCALLVAALGVYGVYRDDHLGGEPYAVASIDKRPPESPPAPAAPTTSTPLTLDVGTHATASGAQMEAASGVKVVRAGGGTAPGALIIQVQEALGAHLIAAPDKRLIDKSRYGLLPRIGPDGSRPAEVYARPVLTSSKLKAGAPRIAMLVGGLGLNAESTASAISRLPGAVSLGFAPYGGEVERQAALAREAGHETLLQLPMEPFDYPASNPGPHTLLSAATEAENLDSLHWLLTRFVGYVGVSNYLGAKFTANAAALTPILNEIAKRGLIFVDDGSSPRSLSRDKAAGLNLPAVAADMVIDTSQSPDAIAAALSRLEALARANGVAIGVAAAIPAGIEPIGRWAASLDARGVALVPLSAAVLRAPGPAAQAQP